MANERNRGKRIKEREDRPIPTLNGGYSHTKNSRKKIGLANEGNTPWNKGRMPSEEDTVTLSFLKAN